MTGKGPEVATPEAVREQVALYQQNRIRQNSQTPALATMVRYGSEGIGGTVLLTLPAREISNNVLETPSDHPYNDATLWESAAQVREKHPEATVLIDFYDQKVMSYNGHERWDDEPLVTIAQPQAAAEAPVNKLFSAESQYRQRLLARLRKVWGR